MKPFTSRDNVAERLAPQLPSKIPSLDGLRAVSIGFVLFSHAFGTRNFPVHSFPAVGAMGSFGVRVFFIISGFLITTLLLKERARTGRISIKAFYTRRFLRIFPAFYTYVGACAILLALGWRTVLAGDLLHALTYTVNYHHPHGWLFAHIWSLSVEEQFYLLWPAVIAFAGPLWAARAAMAAILVVPVFRLATLQFFPMPAAYFGQQFHLTADALATGCLLAAAHNWLGSQPRYLDFLRGRFFVLVPIFGLLLNGLSEKPRIMGLAGSSLMNLAIVLTMDRMVRFPNGFAGRLLNTEPVRFVGVLSYSLYLWQQLFLDRSSSGPMQAFPVNVLGVFAAALLSYCFVEKPFLRLKDRFSKEHSTGDSTPDLPADSCETVLQGAGSAKAGRK